MSRIGNRKLTIPENVEVNVTGNNITVKSSKGELSLNFSDLVKVEVKDKVISVIKKQETTEANIMAGTTNSHIYNMLEGVSKGFTKELEAVGVGYRFALQGNKLVVSAGYSNNINVEIPSDIKITSPSNTEIVISGIDKQKVSEFAANVRKIRKPEPYKGKGIRYKGEQVRRKEGKKAAK